MNQQSASQMCESCGKRSYASRKEAANWARKAYTRDLESGQQAELMVAYLCPFAPKDQQRWHVGHRQEQRHREQVLDDKWAARRASIAPYGHHNTTTR